MSSPEKLIHEIASFQGEIAITREQVRRVLEQQYGPLKTPEHHDTTVQHVAVKKTRDTSRKLSPNATFRNGWGNWVD